MKYFAFPSFHADQSEVIPPFVSSGSDQEKREWLYNHFGKILNKYIIVPQTQVTSSMHQVAEGGGCNTQNTAELFQCRAASCNKAFRFKKVRSNHERKIHSEDYEDDEMQELLENPKEQDDVFNYVTARLKLGLLLKNVDDAVKEGDGRRIICCWRFFLLLYKAYNHHKYAIAAFHLISRVDALLTPVQAEPLIWNRTVNRKGGEEETYRVTCV